MGTMFKASIYSLLVFYSVATVCSGAERLNYQGKLAHGNSPVTATVPMTFQIFDGQAGTNVLYEESMDVEVVDGYYSIELGEFPNFGQLVSAIKRQDAHIQVTVDGNPMRPREKVGKPPFAEKSSTVITVAGKHKWLGEPGTHMTDALRNLTGFMTTYDSDASMGGDRITGNKMFVLPIHSSDKYLESYKVYLTYLTEGIYSAHKLLAEIQVRDLEGNLLDTFCNVNFRYLAVNQWIELPLTGDTEDRLVPANCFLLIKFYTVDSYPMNAEFFIEVTLK